MLRVGEQVVTASGYTATYDASGNVVCRAPNSTLTCAPPAGQTATGQQLGYDAAGRLTSWQDGTESPPNVAVTYAYDGEGNRVAQHVLSFGSSWTTAYLLGDTAETTEGSGTFTDYLAVPGVGTAVETNSPSSPAVSYLVTDGLNSVSVALDALGNVAGQVLYFPYGGARYVTGRFPTTHGFTGQDEDGNTTGLYYDHARYYDPTIGQFAQADTDDKGGLNHFAYVRGNPETDTDPTGHMQDANDGGGNSPPPPPPPPNNKRWENYRQYYLDNYQRHPWRYFKDIDNDSKYSAEYTDGLALFHYFGWADQGTDGGIGPSIEKISASKNPYGTTADYVAGLANLGMFTDDIHVNSLETGTVTPIDLYKPNVADPDKIRAEAVSKGKKAPIVVIDITGKTGLTGDSDAAWAERNDLAARIINYLPNRENGTSVMRVIYIDNDDPNGPVVGDFNPYGYGPAPYADQQTTI